MPEIVSACVVCGHKVYDLVDSRSSFGFQIENHACRECGVVFLSPRMTEAELASFYVADYRRLYGGAEAPADKDLQRQRGRAESLLSFCRRHVSSAGSVLEIGASAGVVLDAFRRSYGSNVVGLEPGNAFRDHAAQTGLKMVATLAELGETRFDLIVMSHVLEHLADPVTYLSRLRDAHLGPKGFLLIEVPNVYCHDSFEVAHLFSFSETTLKQILARAGFAVVALEKHGRPVSRVLPLYLTVLARPADGKPGIKADRHVLLKRRVGVGRRRVLARILGRYAWNR